MDALNNFMPNNLAWLNTSTHQLTLPNFTLQYEKKDITEDVKLYLLSIEYTDFLGEQSDELTVSFEDVDGKWIRSWYPSQGDKLTFSLGDQFTGLVDLGSFEIAEIEYQLMPSTITIKALATGISHGYRTRLSKAYENTTLAGIVKIIAKRLHLKLTGTVSEIKIQRITQYQETDVEFLTRLARQYGHTFKIVDKTLVFMENTELTKQDAVLIINPADVISGQFRDQIKNVPDKVVVSGYDAKKKQSRVISKKATARRHADKNHKKTANDTLRIVVNRGESNEQLSARASAAISDAEDEQISGNLELFGNVQLVAGQIVQLKNYGLLSGRYLVKQAHHRVEKSSGYTTELEIKMLEYIADENEKQETKHAE